jgi:hypothetical protein
MQEVDGQRHIEVAMDLSIKGLPRFLSSKGLAGEAMKGNVEKEPLILRIDASKLSLRTELCITLAVIIKIAIVQVVLLLSRSIPCIMMCMLIWV